MLKEFWFKIRNRRNEHISEEIRKDLEFYLDLNYIPEELEREATGALYDATELSRAIEWEESEALAPEAMPDDYFLEEAESHALEESEKKAIALPPEEDFYTSYDYLPGKSAEEFEDDYTEIGAPFSGESVTEFSGRLASAPQAPAADSRRADTAPEELDLRDTGTVEAFGPIESRRKRRIGMPLPEVGRIGSARPDSVQSPKSRQPARGSQPALAPEAPQALQRQSLDDVISALGMSFQQKLLTLIDAKGYSDPQVYRKANLDRKLFSKIRCNADYKPSKLTALALAIALELNLDEATDLLGRAGLALSPSSLTDMIVKYCITNQIYDIYDVNALLYEHDQQLLGL